MMINEQLTFASSHQQSADMLNRQVPLYDGTARHNLLTGIDKICYSSSSGYKQTQCYQTFTLHHLMEEVLSMPLAISFSILYGTQLVSVRT